MKRKPWPIIILALLHVLAPFGNIVLNSYRAGRTFSQTWDMWLHNFPKPLFFAYVVIPPLAGVFIYICKRWSYWAYLVCLGGVFLANVYGFWTSMNALNLITLIVVLVTDVLAVAYFMAPSVRQVYFDPRMRWWETAPRYLFEAAAEINGASVLIKNISQGGALVETGSPLEEGRAVDIKWQFQGESYLVPGVVVYKKPQGSGFSSGVKFSHTSQTEKKQKEFIRKLHKAGHMVRDRLPTPEDSFGVWLKKLILRRQGLFPRD